MPSWTRGTTILLVAFLVAGFIAGIAVAAITPLTPSRTYATTLTNTQTTTVTKAYTTTLTQPSTVMRAHTTTLTLQSVVVTQTITTSVPHIPLTFEVKYSRQFEIRLVDGYKIVRDALNRTLILVPRGQQPPPGLNGVVVYTPVERVVLMSATQVALVERLREHAPWILDRVVGIMWGGQYEWYFEEVAERLSQGVIRDVGPDYSPNFEEIVTLRPDLVIIYTFPGSDLPTRLEELGIPYVVDNEYLETTSLGRFEWIKLIATFFNLDEEAYRIFSEVEGEVSRIVSDIKRAGLAQPVACWFMVYRGVVYVAGGQSFPANTLAMLGARYAFSDLESKGSVTINIEKLLSSCRDADVVVYPTSFISSVQDILSEAPELGEIKAFREGRVYAYAPTIFQLGYYDTEGWIRDLAIILYPNLYPGQTTTYFIRLGG
ncbi:MAG: ABC transporter substrate-binding protein [Nitrososphaerota archaeon]